MGWRNENFFKFICYNQNIYSNDSADEKDIGYIQLYEQLKKSTKLTSYIPKNDMKLKLLQSEMSKNFNNSLPETVLKKMIHSLAPNVNLVKKDAKTNSYTNLNNWMDQVKQLLATPIGSYGSKNTLFSTEEIEAFAQHLRTLVTEKNFTIATLKGFYSDLIGEVSERTLNEYLNTTIQQSLSGVTESFKSKVTGDYVYGNGKVAKGAVINTKQGKKTVYGSIEKFRGGKHSYLVDYYAGNNIKLDIITEVGFKKEKTVDNTSATAIDKFSIGVKSHWSQSKSTSKIQVADKTLREIFSLYNFYVPGGQISPTKNDAYWWYMNVLFYEGISERIRTITRQIIYAAYFGNVDYEIDLVPNKKTGSVDLHVLSIRDILGSEKFNKYYIKLAHNPRSGVSLQESHPYSKKDIGVNEAKLLDSIKFKGLTLTLRNLIK